MVAMLGMIMPEPLAMPATVKGLPSMTPVRSDILGFRSVVMMALATWARLFGANPAANWGTAGSSLVRLSGCPMTPVEARSTSSAGHPRAFATISAEASAAFRPTSPVQALAWPALTRMALARPFLIFSLHHSTGAAATRFRVKTPATTAGSSATMRPRSSRVLYRRPPAKAADLKTVYVHGNLDSWGDRRSPLR